MRTFTNQAAQGDILINRIDELPEGLTEIRPEKGQIVVAHSETGHHHAIAARGVQAYQNMNNPMVMFLVVKEKAELEHHRSFDTHETLAFDKGIYEIRRQREYTPEGWRRVED